MKKRLLSAFLALSMILSVMPSAFAQQTLSSDEKAFSGSPTVLSGLKLVIGAAGEVTEFTATAGAQFISGEAKAVIYVSEAKEESDSTTFKAAHVQNMSNTNKNSYTFPVRHFTATRGSDGSLTFTQDNTNNYSFTASGCNQGYYDYEEESLGLVIGDKITVTIAVGSDQTEYTSADKLFVYSKEMTLDEGLEIDTSGGESTVKTLTASVQAPLVSTTTAVPVADTDVTASGYTISNVAWSDGTNAVTSGNFKLNTSYTLEFDAALDSGTLDAAVVAKVNGNDADESGVDTDNGTLHVSYTFDPITADSIDIVGTPTTATGSNYTNGGAYTVPSDLYTKINLSDGGALGGSAGFQYGTSDWSDNNLSIVIDDPVTSGSYVTYTGQNLDTTYDGKNVYVQYSDGTNTYRRQFDKLSMSAAALAGANVVVPTPYPGANSAVSPYTSASKAASDSSAQYSIAASDPVDWALSDDSAIPSDTFLYGTQYKVSVDLTPTTGYSFPAFASGTYTVNGANASGFSSNTIEYIFPAIASPSITARTNSGSNYDYYSGAAETFTVTQANKVFTAIQSVAISNGTQTKTVTAANNTSNKYFSITSNDAATQTLTITKDFLDEFAKQIIDAGTIDSISATTPQDWTVTVNFAGNGTAATAAATHIKAVNTTPYLTITQPTSGTGTIAFSGTAPTAVKTNVYPLTKGSSYTLSYNSAPAHTRANDYTWTGGGYMPSDTDGTTDDASYSFDVPAATTSDGARYTITASSSQPTRTITVTVTGGATGDSVNISPTTLAAATTGSVTGGTITYTVYADTAYTITSSTSSTRMISSYTDTAAATTTPNSQSKTESIAAVTSGSAGNLTMAVTFAARAGASIDTTAVDWYSDSLSPTSFDYINYQPGDYGEPTVTLAGTTLTKGTDYTIDTANNKIVLNTTTSTVRSALGTSTADKILKFNFGAGGAPEATIHVHGARSVTSAALTAYTHGDKFNTAGHTLTLVVNDNGSKTYTYDTNTGDWSGAGTSAPTGLVIKVNGGTGMDFATFISTYGAAAMYNSTNTSGGTGLENGTAISFGISSTTPANLNGSNGVIVNKKDLTLTPATTNSTGWNKVYDGTSTAPGTLSATATTSDIVSWDASHKDTINDANFTVTGKYYTTVAYTTEAATYNGGTPWQVGFSATSTDADAANYNLNVTGTTGTISRAPLYINAISAPNASLGDDFTTPKTATKRVYANGTLSAEVTTTSTIYKLDGTNDDTINLTYYYSYGDTSSLGSKTNGVTIYNQSHATYAAMIDNTNYEITNIPSPVDGFVAAETVNTISIAAQPFLTYNYGNATAASGKVVGDDYSLDLSSMKVKVGSDTYTYTPASSNWVSGAKTLSTSQLKVEWTGGSTAAHNDVLQPRLHHGKTLTVTYTANSDPTNQPTAVTSAVTVNKATLTVTPSYSGSLEKVYDGDEDVDNATYTYSITAGIVKHRDNANNDDTVSLTGSGITAAYKASTVGSVNYDNNDVVWNAAGSAVTNKPIAFTVASSGTLTGDHADNYAIAAIPDEANGMITQRPLKVSSITYVQAAKKQDYSTQSSTVTRAYNATSGKNRVAYEGATNAADGVVSGDRVDIDFTYTYRSADIALNTVTTGENDYTVDITGITFTTPDLATTANNNGNYSISDTTTPTTGTGQINDVVIQGITLSIPKSGNSNTYTYVDDENLDLNGARVTVQTDGGNNYYYYSNGTAISGVTQGWYKVSSGTATPTSGATPESSVPFTLRWNDTTLTGTASNQGNAAHGDTLNTSIMTNNYTDYRIGKIAAVHTDGVHYSSQLDVRINKKELSKITAVRNGTITKVYNNSTALLTGDAAKIEFHAYYTPSGGTETETTDISPNVTPTYASQYYSASDIDIVFVNNDLVLNSTMFKLGSLTASSIQRDANLVGTITQRPITVTLDNTSYVADRYTNDSSTVANLTENTNYTVGLTSSPVNGSETNALVSSDSVTLSVAGNFPDLTKGDDKQIVITDSNVTLANGTTDARNSYLITVKPDPADNYVLGNVKAQGRKLTVNSAHGTAKVYDDSDNEITGTSGVYNLEYNESYYIEVDPDNSNTAGGYRVDTISAVHSGSTDVGGTQAAVASSNKVRYNFTMPDADSTATVTFKQLPEWNPEPTAIDKNGNLTLTVKNDYNPTSVTIDGLTLTSGVDYTISGKTITVNQNALKPLAIGATPTVTVGFAPDLATDDFTLTATPAVSNSAASVKSLNKVTDPTQQPDTTLKYGAGLDLNGMKFYTEVKQTGEKTTQTYYKYDNGWYKTTVISALEDGTPVAPADGDINTAVADITDENITLAWTTTTNSPGTPAQDQLLKNSAHNANTITVTWSDGDSGKNTYATGAWTVGKVALNMTATNDPATAKISKTYDTSAAVGTDASSNSNLDKIVIGVTGWVNNTLVDDRANTIADKAANFVVSASDATLDPNASSSDKTVKATWKISGSNLAEYTVTMDGTTTNSFDAATEFTKNFTGEINKKDITIDSVTIPTLKVNEVSLEKGLTDATYAQAVTDAPNYIVINSGTTVYSADQSKLKFTFKGTYSDKTADTSGSQHDFAEADDTAYTTSPSGKYTYAITDTDSGVTSGNYNFTWPSQAHGTVEDVAVLNISIVTHPEQTVNATKAYHGDALDLSDLEVIIHYDTNPRTDSGNIKYGTPDWTDAGLKVKFDGADIADGTTLRYDTHDGHNSKSFVVEKGGKTATINSLIVDPRPITANVSLPTNLNKTYDGSDELLPAAKAAISSTIVESDATTYPVIAAIMAADGIDGTLIKVDARYSDYHAANGVSIDLSSTDHPITIDSTNANAQNYTVSVNASSGPYTGDIGQRTINLETINIEPVYVNTTATYLTKDHTAAGDMIDISDKDNIAELPSVSGRKYAVIGTGGEGEVATGDTVKLAYKAIYSASDVSATKAYPFELTLSDTDYTVSGKGVKNDYIINFPTAASAIVGQGEVKEKTLSSIQAVPADADQFHFLHGDELDLTGLTLTLKYTDSENGAADEVYVYGDNGAAGEGWFKDAVPTDGTTAPVTLPNSVVLKWYKNNTVMADVAQDYVMRYDNPDGYFTDGASTGADKHGQIRITNEAAAPNEIATTVETTVAKRDVTLFVTGTVEKTYDSTNKTDSTTDTAATLTYTWENDAVNKKFVLAADATALGTVGMNYLFNDSTVDADGLISTGGGALAAADLTYTGTAAIADNYNITVDTTTGEVGGVTGVTATINKRTLKVTNLPGPTIMVGDPATGTVTLRNNATDPSELYTQPDADKHTQGRDIVEIEYDYNFTGGTAVAATDVTVTFEPDSDGETVRIKNANDTPGKNYTLEYDTPGKGTIKNKGVTLVSVTQSPTKTEYTHGDTLDMTGSEITLAYSDGTTAAFEYSATDHKWMNTADPTATLPTNVVVAWAGTDTDDLKFDGTYTFDDKAVQRYDEANALTHTKTISVYRKNDAGAVTNSAIATITVKQKEITEVLITGDDFDKRYNAKKDAAVTNQVATVEDSNLVVKTPGTPDIYDDVKLKITKVEYPDTKANANSSGIELATANNFGYDMDYTIDFDNTGVNDNINYTLNLSGANAINTRHSASDTDPIKGVIKQLHVVFDYAPVTAVIKDEDAQNPQQVTMTNKVINNSSAEAIHIDVDEANGKYDMPDEDKGVFRASYKATYSVDHIKGTDTTGLTVTDQTYSGINTNNYDFEWPTLTPKLIVSADEIRAVTADYTAEFTHGDPLNLNGMKFTIVYTGSTPDAEFECTALGWTKDSNPVNLVDEGIILEWVQAKDTDGTTSLEVSQGSPVLLHEHHATQSGTDRVDQIRIKAPNSDGNYRTTTTGNITIHPKEIWVGVTATDLDKTYDTTDTIETVDRDNVEFTFYSADPTSVVDPTTIEYTGALIGDNDKFYIKEDWVAKYASANVKWDSDEYQPTDVANKVVAQAISLDDLELDGDTVTGTSYTYAANYVLKNAANVFGEDDLAGKITPATAAIAVSLTQLPEIYTSTLDADRTDKTLTAGTDYTVSTINDEAVNVTVKYDYPLQAQDDTNRHPNITLKSEPTTGDAVSTPTTNYIYAISPNPMVGLISDVAVVTLEVTDSPKTSGYKHGNTVSLDGMAFKAATNDGTEYEYVFVDLKNPDGTDAGSGWAPKNDDPAHVYTAAEVEYIYVEDVDDGYTLHSGWAKKDSDPAHLYTVAELTGISPANIQLAWVEEKTEGGETTYDAVTPTEDGRLIRNTHNGAKLQITAGGKHAETDAFNIQPMPLYVKAAATDIEKPYDRTSALNGRDADGNAIDNLGKINYTLWTLDEDGDSFTLFDTVRKSGDDIDAKNATSADFAKDNAGTLEADANVAFDGAGAVTDKPIILTGIGLQGGDFTNENYAFAGLTSSVAAANADPNAAPLTGTITKLSVDVTATGHEKVTSETADGTRVDITDWTVDPAAPYADDKDAIGGFSWKGTYNSATDPRTVTPDNTATYADNETSRNYAFNFLQTPVNVALKPKVAGEIQIKAQPKFVRDANPEDPTVEAVKPTHGDKLDSEWEGFEYWVTYTEDGVDVSPSKHKLLPDGTWKTDEGYTVPEDNTVFTWMNNNEAVTGFQNPDTYARADKNNQLKISLTGADGVEPVQTTAVVADPKAVEITAGGEYSRPYDGTATVYGTPFTFTVPASELSPEDAAAGTEVTAVTTAVFVASSEDYKDKDVEGTEGAYTKPVKFGTPTIANTNYVPKQDGEGNYIINKGADFKSAITPKTLNITAISINGRSSSDAKEFTVEKSNAFTTTGLAEGDNDITIGYKGTYTGTSGDVPVTITDLVIDGPDAQAARNYTPDFTGEATVNVSTGGNGGGGGGGGGGGSVNTLTVHYKNEDGTAGDDVSSIYAPLGTDPVDLIGVFKSYIKDKTVLWTSSDESVATVDENGHVTFVGEGTATITAQSKTTKSLKDTVQITISEAPPTPTYDPSAPTPSPTPRPVYDKKDSLITKTMLNPYIVGYDDYVFGPELPISREELATIFARLIANDLYMDQDYDTSFPDVPDEWSKPYIGYLEQFDVVTGYEDGDFRPKNYITRAEMAVMMAKAEGYNLDGYVSSEDTGFPDMDEGYSTWAATKAIKILTDMGIMEGYTDGTFRPGKPITRAETVATVNRVLADMEVADYAVLPSDVTDAHWAYNDIVFAMNHRVLKDAAADPQRFVWSEQFDENMIINTEKVEGETVKVGEETPAEDDANKEETSDNPDAVAAENKEDTSEGDNATTTE